MAYKHGVYTSEVETSLQAAPAVDSALPFVVGASVKAFDPIVVSSWRQFVEVSGITEGTHDVAGENGWFSHSLVSFAYLWFRLCGRSDCIMCGIQSADGALAKNDIISALGKIDTVYERVRRLPSLICVPYFANVAEIWLAMKAKGEQYGGRFKALAVGDIPCNENACSDASPSIVSSPSDVAAAKTVQSEAVALFWPYIGIGDLRFDLSSAACAVMNRVDAQNGNLPFVSPSNKNCYATGVYTLPLASEEIDLCTTDADLYVVKGGVPVTIGAGVYGATAEIGGNACSADSGKWKSPAAVDGKARLTVRKSSSSAVFFVAKTAGASGNSLAISIKSNPSTSFDVTLYNGDAVLGTQSNITSAQYIGSAFDAYVDVTYTGDGGFVATSKTFFSGGGGEAFSVSYPVETPLFQSRDDVNNALGVNGIIGALNTADGWNIWGNNLTCFPGNTDVKDYLISIRRMFNYTQNLFQIFAQPRIDNPLNRRQLEGVVSSFNQILASLQGFGALNSAAVELDDERNTTEQLIRGVVYFRIRIAPPPPMQEINGVFEFDVQGFEASLA